ncbi:MAG: hypothetical protein JSR77_15975 [Planctomycetes bacterium]|nr:hypothetical protein [Planctomycetota bacterium]
MNRKPEPINYKRYAIIAACALVLLGAVTYTIRELSDKTPIVVGAYYLDLNTGKIFVGPTTSWPPIETPSGPHENEAAGVRVYLFSCAPCGNLDGKTLAEAEAMGATALWVEKYKADAKKALDAGDRSPEVLMEGLVMRAPTGTKWISPAGREGVAIRKSVSQLCSGNPASPCNPR